MRLAVFSDIHGNYTALEAALADLEASGGADITWFLGDLAAFGPRPAESVQRVKAMLEAVKDDEAKRHTVRALQGNTDRYLVYGQRPKVTPAKNAEEYVEVRHFMQSFSDRLDWCLQQLGFEEYEFLHKLGHDCDLYVEGYGYVIGYHGVPGDDEGYALTPTSPDNEAADALLDREGRLAIGGHIHLQMDRSIGHWRVINVGSVGCPFDNNIGKAEYALFTFVDGEVQVDLRAVPYDVESVIADSEQRGNPATAWLASRLRSSAE